MKLSNFLDQDFLLSEENEVFLESELIENTKILNEYTGSKNKGSRRVYLFLAWLPISKESSHVIYFFKILKYFVDLGYECIILISCNQFTHHRGINFYLNNTKEQIKIIFSALIQSVIDIDMEKIKFEFFAHRESFCDNTETLKYALDSYVFKQMINSSDFVILTSGNLNCRYLDSVASILTCKKILVLTNINDNIERYVSWIDYVISPNTNKSVIKKFSQAGLDCNKILNYSNVPQSFKWAEGLNEYYLSEYERNTIERISNDNSDGLIICASARFSDKSLLMSYLDFFNKSKLKNHSFLMIGASTEVLHSCTGTAGENNSLHNLPWVKNLYLLFSILSERFKCIFVNLDSSGGNTIANAVVAKIPVVIPFASDADSFVASDTKFSSEIECFEILVKLLVDGKYFNESVLKNLGMIKTLHLNNLNSIRSIS